MILLYVPRLTNRLGYTINVVMRDLLQADFAITTDANKFSTHKGACLCYGPTRIGDESVPYIKSCKLLFETVIEEQDCHYFLHNGLPALFPVFGKGLSLPFDIFASIFFIAARYEEYLPHHKDSHDRYMATESLAYRQGFLQTAIVDRWALLIRDIILTRYPDTYFKPRKFNLVHTIDIDAAYCYRHKGIFRSCMGILRDSLHRHDTEEVRRRMRVLRKKEPDPYDTFDYILEQQKKRRHCELLFFALLGDYGIYDKPTSYHVSEFRQLLQHLGDYAKVGIHGSYYSSEEPERLDRERQRLADIMHRPIVRNRFHFLRFKLPTAYRNLKQVGILHDYTMGYADMPGFRCGTGSEIPFFDLSSDLETPVRLHPFIAMDTTFHTHMQASPQEAIQQFHTLIDEVREVGGTFTCIFHNQNLCEDFGWEGWRAVYEDILNYASNPVTQHPQEQ